MTANPKLMDVQCSRMQFQPGDKILVKARTILSSLERKQIRKMVEKWAGDHVAVLVVDPSLEIIKNPNA